MTDDVLVLLRQADPVAGAQRYDEVAIEENLAAILASPDRPVRSPRRRTPARRGAVAAFAFVAVLGAGTAVAAGWPDRVREAFDNPVVRQSLVEMYGSGADLAKARELVSIPGPDGSTVSTWTVPVATAGICTAILPSVPSAPLADTDGALVGDQILCGEVHPPRLRIGELRMSFDFTGAPWRSPETGIEYFNYSGRLATAAQIEVRIPGGPTYHAAIANGYYLVGSVPSTQLECATLVRLDAKGNQLEPPMYLTDSCPTDPAALVSPPPLPPVDPAKTVQQPWGMAFGYSNTLGVIVNALIKQDPSRGTGSGDGMSLITVQLQFYKASRYPTTFPASVSFDLLYGDEHTPARVDPGKHGDADLSGVWTPPGPPSSGEFVPQRSFDVPTDQLSKLQVRLNGDATHPTVIFLDSQRALPSSQGPVSTAVPSH